MRNWKKSIALFIVLVMVGMLAACGGSGAAKISIGAQTYTETKIIAEMYKALIEDRTDIEVDIVKDLSASPIVIGAMEQDEIQMATLYSGEAFNGYFEMEDTNDREAVLQQAQAGFDEHYNFKWFDSYGFENTYAFTVRQDLADEHNLETISDVAAIAGDLRLGVDTTWLERPVDGYPAFVEHYGFEFGNEFPMDINLVYEAVASEEVDIVLAYSTDPRLQEFNLKTLEDDLAFFPPFDASAVVKNETLEANPGLDEVISQLVGQIDATTMTSLSYEVDVNQRGDAEVAQEFLRERGLLD